MRALTELFRVIRNSRNDPIECIACVSQKPQWAPTSKNYPASLTGLQPSQLRQGSMNFPIKFSAKLQEN